MQLPQDDFSCRELNSISLLTLVSQLKNSLYVAVQTMAGAVDGFPAMV